MHNFNYNDGSFPDTTLVQATDGNFYGATLGGPNGPGTIFRMTPNGALTTLHSFNTSDGASPCCGWGLLQATDGNFHGATALGGAYNEGSIFKLTPAGALTTLHSFDSVDGASPNAAPIQNTNGQFFGTATDRGLYGYATVFGLSMGLGPFVETEPAYGKVGDTIKILGTDLAGATSVTFNGTPAVFRVISRSLIEATVPVGVTSGQVYVGLQKVRLLSSAPFRVRQ